MVSFDANQGEERQIKCSLCSNDKFIAIAKGSRIFLKCTDCGKKLIETDFFE